MARQGRTRGPASPRWSTRGQVTPSEADVAGPTFGFVGRKLKCRADGSLLASAVVLPDWPDRTAGRRYLFLALGSGVRFLEPVDELLGRWHSQTIADQVRARCRGAVSGRAVVVACPRCAVEVLVEVANVDGALVPVLAESGHPRHR